MSSFTLFIAHFCSAGLKDGNHSKYSVFVWSATFPPVSQSFYILYFVRFVRISIIFSSPIIFASFISLSFFFTASSIPDTLPALSRGPASFPDSCELFFLRHAHVKSCRISSFFRLIDPAFSVRVGFFH